MDNQEQYTTVPSREEYIRIARESCARNLSGMNGSGKPGLYNDKKVKLGWKQGKVNNDLLFESSTMLSMSSVKLLLIRTICALVLILSIILIDQFHIKINKFTSNTIKESITSSQTIEEAEEFFASVIEDFVQSDK